MKIFSYPSICCSVLLAILSFPAHAGNLETPSTTTLSPIVGELQNTTTKYEDTLVHLARKYGVGFVELRAANPGVDPWLPGSGTNLIIPTQHLLPDAPHHGVVINLSEMRLYYFETPGQPPLSFPIGIGRSGLTTPLGTTTVARKNVDPIWYPTDRMRKEDPTLPAAVPPGPENPMGTHAFYLGWPSYAIHGTDKPYSVGRRLSSGCIRMYPEDILTLYDRLNVGTQVTVVDQPIKTAWVGDKFYLEAHPNQEQSDKLSHDTASTPEYTLSEDDTQIILKNAGADAESLDWAKIRKAIKERRGVPMIVGVRGEKREAPTPIAPPAVTVSVPAPEPEPPVTQKPKTMKGPNIAAPAKKSAAVSAPTTPSLAPTLTSVAAEARARYQD